MSRTGMGRTRCGGQDGENGEDYVKDRDGEDKVWRTGWRMIGIWRMDRMWRRGTR